MQIGGLRRYFFTCTQEETIIFLKNLLSRGMYRNIRLQYREYAMTINSLRHRGRVKEERYVVCEHNFSIDGTLPYYRLVLVIAKVHAL